MKTTLLSLLLLLPCAVRGQFILASNDLAASSSLCTDAHGALLTTANGYATAGTFTITDAQIAATALVPGGSAALAAGFQAFSGGGARVGESGFSGIFELDGAVGAQSGVPIYIVLHNRSSLAQSDEVLVYKSTSTAPGGDGITSASVALTHNLTDGNVILGVRSFLTATVPGYAENRPTLRMTMMQKLDYDGWVGQHFRPDALPSTTAPEADPDSDGSPNSQEWQNCTDPNEADSDKDGLRDSKETPAGARNADQDGDGVNDGDEAASGTDPLDPFSHVGIADNLTDHWAFDSGEQDQLSCRRLQFAGTGTFTDSLDASARSLGVPMELEAWQLPARTHAVSLAFWFTPGSSETVPPAGIVQVPGLWALTFPPAGGQIRLTGSSGAPLNAGPGLPDGLRHHIGLVLRPGSRAELYIDGLAAGSVPLGINTAGAPLLFGASGSPHFIDELLLWERAACGLEMGAAASQSAALLYPAPSPAPMDLLCFRRGLDSTSGAMQVELHWAPPVPAAPAQIRISADSVTWTTLATTMESSAILEFPAPGPSRSFFKVQSAP